MPPPPGNPHPDPAAARRAAQRSGIALVLAALREDHESVAAIVTAATRRELADVAVFCAQFAATKCREQERATPGLDVERAVEAVALRLAVEEP